jgi:hypothetical protein
MANIKIAIINASNTLKDDEVKAAVPAFQKQVRNDFAPAWGVDADLVFVKRNDKPPAGAWWLVLLDNSDQAGALGYHDLTTDGLPLGKVFAATDKQYGYQWTVTVSHELLEMLVDPDINLTAGLERQNHPPRFYSYEVCDACEADNYGYKIDNVLVSDFVYPAWFEGFRKKNSTQFDHGKRITAPFQLLKGGYISYYDANGSGWTQTTAEKEVPRYSERPNPGSRRERRRTPRDQWLMSTPKALATAAVQLTSRVASA